MICRLKWSYITSSITLILHSSSKLRSVLNLTQHVVRINEPSLPAVEGVVGFYDEAAPEFSLSPEIELITLRYPEMRVEAAGEVEAAGAELSDEWGVGGECFGETQIRGDEGAALGCGEVVGVEVDGGLAECELFNRAEQCPVEEEAGADAQNRPARAEGVEGEAEAGAEVVAVGEDCLALVAEAGREGEARAGAPLILDEEAGVGVLLRGVGAEALAEAGG